MRKLGPFDIYKHLPKLNCGDCGEETCIAFAVKLLNRKVLLNSCPHLREEQQAKLRELVSPPVQEITIGTGKMAVRIGGEEVLYRHELSFLNPTKIAVEIRDTAPEEQIAGKAKTIEDFQIEVMGQKAALDLIALRAESANRERFSKAAAALAESRKPIILCSEDPKVMEAGLEVVGSSNPLIYAANPENWGEMSQLALKHKCPLALSSSSVAELRAMVKASTRAGINSLVLDPATKAPLAQALDNLAMVRKAAVKGDKDLGFPIGIASRGQTPVDEGIFTSIWINRWASLVMVQSLDRALLTTLLTLRQNIYTDPRVTPCVDPGLYHLGSPNKESPVLLTTNYALTYFIVTKDIREAGINCHLLVVDTGGLSVENSLAAKRIDGRKVSEAVASQSLEQKVEHRKLIIPGLLAKLRGEIEDALGWEVLVGPIYSKDIGVYLRRIWPVKASDSACQAL